jgi:hypothetical protein
MTVYHYETNSNAAPFFSDSDAGFVEANTPKEAIEKVVKEYTHSCGLYAAVIKTCEVKPKVLARFLSAKAVCTEDAIAKSKGGILSEGGKVRIRTDKGDVYLDVKDYKDSYEFPVQNTSHEAEANKE